MKSMRLLFTVVLALFFAGSAACAAEPRSFSLSTQRTFAPGEQMKIQLYSRNVSALEFRVYKVRDTEKFFSGLKDLHSFGTQSYSPSEQIDKRTLIERLHAFKAGIWWNIRHFFRSQFTSEARDSVREHQASLGKRSRIVGATELAGIPLLNESQLVARWKLIMPPSLVSETQILPIDNPGPGVYLIEATDGTYKAYTLAIVTSMVLVERSFNSNLEVFVADRKTGAPISAADVVFWASGNQKATAKTSAEGFAPLSMGEHAGQPENLWVLAHKGSEAAIVTPWGYGFNENAAGNTRAFIYTDRPVYRPGHDVHIKAILRGQKDDNLLLPANKTVQLTVRDADDKAIFKKDLPVSAHGTVSADLTLASDASLGYYNIQL